MKLRKKTRSVSQENAIFGETKRHTRTKTKISLHCKKHIHFNAFAGVRLNNWLLCLFTANEGA